ncbi:MAG: SDR family oxidoreductase [Pseudomonadota bacterium]
MPSHSKPDLSKRLLIAGFGDLGRRLAERVSAYDHNVWHSHALRRSVEPAAASSDSITAIQADLTQPDSLVPIAGHWDAVVYTATPSERTPEGYRNAYLHGLNNLLQQISTDRLIVVSSTAVYGQDQGEWVDEYSPTEPQGFNGQILLEAEQRAFQADGIVVRFSGIYGPGRTRLIERVRNGAIECRRQPPIWTNRIHADDCAAVLAHLLELEKPEAVYLASDHEPVTRWDLYEWLAKRLSVPGPIEVADPAAGQGKRVKNHHLFNSGFDFRYRSFRQGYDGLIDAL